MKKIQLHDKTFISFIKEEKLIKVVTELGLKINKDYNGKRPIIIGILNGVVVFLADLFKQLNIDCELAFMRVSSYEGKQTTGDVKESLSLNIDITDRDVIVVEDIVDTGNTIEKLDERLKKLNPKSIKYATLLFKPKAYTKSISIDYIGLEVGNEFLVGYGLDYDQLGRNLNGLYILEDKTS